MVDLLHLFSVSHADLVQEFSINLERHEEIMDFAWTRVEFPGDGIEIGRKRPPGTAGVTAFATRAGVALLSSGTALRTWPHERGSDRDF